MVIGMKDLIRLLDMGFFKMDSGPLRRLIEKELEVHLYIHLDDNAFLYLSMIILILLITILIMTISTYRRMK